jgi:Tfp pilus assembly PilM family ATPase
VHFRFHSNTAPIGLDHSGRSLCAVQLSRQRTNAPIASAVRLPRVNPLADINVDELRHAAEVMQRQGFHGRSIVLAMPYGDLMTESIDGMSPDASETQIRDEIARSHRVDPASFEFACWALPGRQPKRATSTIMAVACRHETAESYLDLFQDAGFDVCGLDVQPWALARACRKVLMNSGSACIVDIGWNGAHLSVLNDRVVLYTRTMSDAALREVHCQMTESLAIDHQMASYLIDEVGLDGAGDPTSLSATHGHLMGYVEKLESELQRSIDYVRHEYPDHVPGQLILVGDGAAMPGLRARLETTIGVSSPELSLHDLAGLRSSSSAIHSSSALTTALGLARYPKR